METVIRHRRSYWMGVCAAPLAWLADALAAIAISYDFCSGGRRPIGSGPSLALLAVGIAAAIVAVLGTLAAWRNLDGRPDNVGLDDTVSDRLQFMARFGVVISTLALVAIVFRVVATLFLSSGVC